MNYKLISILFIFILLFQTISFSSSVYVWNDGDTTEVNSDDVDNFLNIESKSAILIEQTTGQILYEKNSHEQLRPASVTKIMSILLIMEELDSGKITLEDKVTCSEEAASMGGSQIWLEPRRRNECK